MRGISLKDLVWVAHIEYENYKDSHLQISCVDYPDILDAIAKVHKHVKKCYPYEIISITQKHQNSSGKEGAK